MASSAKIIETLKKQLKRHGITYKAVAGHLDLSESAVKHMFSTGNVSLKRLDALCALLELDIGDLVTIAAEQQVRIEELSDEFERELVGDIRLLLVTYCLVNYWSMEEILERYDLSERDALRLLIRLDRMKIIELQPGNRVRLLVSNNFGWRKNGAIERYFRGQAQSQFFASNFDAEGAVRIVKNGMLSKKSQLELADKLRSIGEIFDDATRDERKLTANQRQGTSMVLAVRNWTFEGFRDLER